MIRKLNKKILEELNAVLKKIDEKDADKFANEIIKAKKVFIVGAGRSEMIGSAFAMRLMQLGLRAYVVGEPTTPTIKKNEMLIVVSGSGETETVYDIVQEAKKVKAKVWSVTANKNSKIAKKSNKIILIPAKTKIDHRKSIQPLGSCFEQALLIYLDSLVILLMKRLGERGVELKKSHTTLE